MNDSFLLWVFSQFLSSFHCVKKKNKLNVLLKIFPCSIMAVFLWDTGLNGQIGFQLWRPLLHWMKSLLERSEKIELEVLPFLGSWHLFEYWWGIFLLGYFPLPHFFKSSLSIFFDWRQFYFLSTLYILRRSRRNDILFYCLFKLGKLPAQPWSCPYRADTGKCSYKPSRQTYQSEHCYSLIQLKLWHSFFIHFLS